MIDELLLPIDIKRPEGYCDENDPLLEELEDLMLKYGSLHHGSINWEKVEILCKKLLRKKCKHYRVLLHLITYWLNKRGVDGLIDSIVLLSGFMEKYWNNAYPKPGNINIRYRKKLTEQILFRIDQASPRLSKEIVSKSLAESLNASWHKLEKQIKKKKLESKLKKLIACLTELESNQKVIRTIGNQSTDNSSAGVAAIVNEPASVTPKLTDLGDERQIKRLLFDLADMIDRQNPEDSLGYQLRRYALWSNIQSSPPLNQRGESELLPPPQDVVREYEDQINAGLVTPELIQRIEKSVVASPFWLTGSLYTTNALRILSRKNIASVILDALGMLLQRLPALTEGKFHGGVPYLDKNLMERLQTDCVQGCVTNNDAASVRDSDAAMEWGVLEKEWHVLREEQGIASVLQEAEKHQRRANTPRQVFYLKLLAGEQMNAAGLKHIAKDMLAGISKQVAIMPVSEWEPDYLQRAKPILEEK